MRGFFHIRVVGEIRQNTAELSPPLPCRGLVEVQDTLGVAPEKPLISEVNHLRAWVVLGWVTTWEFQVSAHLDLPILPLPPYTVPPLPILPPPPKSKGGVVQPNPEKNLPILPPLPRPCDTNPLPPALPPQG